jgi:hypothetical protein
MKKLVFVIICLFALSSFAAEEVELPAELQPFVPNDHFALDYETGDLNGDGREDCILIVQAGKPSEEHDPIEKPRPLIILVRSADGSLSQTKRNDKVVYCETCGGVMGDPYQGIKIEKNRFTVQHYGGSAWRWSSEYTFGYSRKDDTWQLVSVELTDFHASDPDNTKQEKLFTPPRDYGKIDIGDFDPENYLGVGPK